MDSIIDGLANSTSWKTKTEVVLKLEIQNRLLKGWHLISLLSSIRWTTTEERETFLDVKKTSSCWVNLLQQLIQDIFKMTMFLTLMLSLMDAHVAHPYQTFPAHLQSSHWQTWAPMVSLNLLAISHSNLDTLSLICICTEEKRCFYWYWKNKE